jgi:hypothetical protein
MLMDLLTRFQEHMDHVSQGTAMLLALGFVLCPAAIAVHEAGHAIVAHRYGARVHEFVAAPEGPALRFVVAGARVRLGLGLLRDSRSREPLGWVDVDVSSLTDEQRRRMVLAGPVAQMAFGAVVLGVLTLAPVSVDVHVVLGLSAGAVLLDGALNLTSDDPRSDGGRIRQLRDGTAGRVALSPGRHVVTTKGGRRSIIDVAPDGRRMLSFFEATEDPGRWVILHERVEDGWRTAGFDADHECWAPTHVDPARGPLGVAFTWGDPHVVRWDVPDAGRSVAPPRA